MCPVYDTRADAKTFSHLDYTFEPFIGKLHFSGEIHMHLEHTWQRYIVDRDDWQRQFVWVSRFIPSQFLRIIWFVTHMAAIIAILIYNIPLH